MMLRRRVLRPAPTAFLLLLAAGGGGSCAASGPAAAGSSGAAGDALGAALKAYVALLAPGPPAAGLEVFMLAHPNWPDRATLRIRYDAALAADADDAEVAGLCGAMAPVSARALGRCAEASGNGRWAQAAWRAGLDAGAREGAAEAAFVRRFGGLLTADDDWARFSRIGPPAGGQVEGAARVAARLTGVRRDVATARVALAGTAPDPMALFGAVPVAGQGDPGLVLLTARALRVDGRLDAALAFWRATAFGVEAVVDAGTGARFWAERDALARSLLAAGRGEDAFAMADDEGARAPTARADALFLAGWIALERLGSPGRARPLFERLGTVSASVTTRARAAYWGFRTSEAAEDQAGALRQAAMAASFPTTFYGQLGLAAMGSPGEGADEFRARLRTALLAEGITRWTTAEAVAFASGEDARAAVTLVAWGLARHAKPFLGAADLAASSPVEHALAASLALSLDLPDEAVAIARRAGREGRAPPLSGWPVPLTPPPGLPAPLVLGLIRQESGFDAGAVSPSGALGLMQLMPATAAETARRARVGLAMPRLTADPSLNMALGEIYLEQLLGRFGGNVPASVAAYNAGPHRVSGWPAAPAWAEGALPDKAMIDWIEAIPVAETRNYVQRVLENRAVYAALAAGGRA